MTTVRAKVQPGCLLPGKPRIGKPGRMDRTREPRHRSATTGGCGEGPGMGNPPSAEHAAAVPQAKTPAAVASSRPRVLIVDDNQDAADSLAMLIQFLGAEPDVAHDGPAALAAVDARRPAMVLLDIGMPGMDGYQVARLIRQQPRFNDIMLIALTGWGEDEDRRRARDSGFDHHLVKPVDVDALRALLMTP